MSTHCKQKPLRKRGNRGCEFGVEVIRAGLSLDNPEPESLAEKLQKIEVAKSTKVGIFPRAVLTSLWKRTEKY